MTSTTRTRGLRPLTTLVALLALVASACGGASADPATRLSSAFEDTFDGSYAYRFAVDADRAALDTLGADAGQAATFLGTFGFSGVVDGDDGMSFALGLGTGSPILELRSFGEEAFYVNVGLGDLLSLAGAGAFDPRDELAPALDALGFDTDVKAAVLDLLDGKWVGVEGQLDAERLQSLLGAQAPTADEEEVADAAEELFGGGIDGFFEEYVTVVDVEDTGDGVEQFEVALQLRELLRAAAELNQRVGADEAMPMEDLEADLADLPETIPGTVVVTDDKVTEIRFDAAAFDEGVAGSILLTLSFSDFDEVDPLVKPEGATVLTDEQFTDAVAKLVGLTGGMGAPLG